jgi:LysM repeat protein
LRRNALFRLLVRRLYMRRVNRFFVFGLIALLVLTLAVGCTRPKPGAPPEETPLATEEIAAVPETATPVFVVSPAAITEVAPPPTLASAEAPAKETVVAAQPTAALTPPLAMVVPTGPPTAVSVEITPFPTPGVRAAEEPTPTPTALPPVVSGQGAVYVVQPGDTLFSIAVRFGVSIDALRAANGLTSDNIVPGQELVIPGVPGPGPTPAPGVVPPPGGGTVHIVQPGENMFRISLMYGTTIEAIAAANGIRNPWFIYVGQRLIIPVPGGPLPPGPGPVPPPQPGGRTHVVQPGETLFSIALRYGVSVQAIALANNLPNPNFIYPGQVLIIP